MYFHWCNQCLKSWLPQLKSIGSEGDIEIYWGCETVRDFNTDLDEKTYLENTGAHTGGNSPFGLTSGITFLSFTAASAYRLT